MDQLDIFRNGTTYANGILYESDWIHATNNDVLTINHNLNIPPNIISRVFYRVLACPINNPTLNEGVQISDITFFKMPITDYDHGILVSFFDRNTLKIKTGSNYIYFYNTFDISANYYGLNDCYLKIILYQ